MIDPNAFVSYKERILGSVGRVIIGKDEIILKVLICFLTNGHILLEDVPGTGKTMLLRAFAKALGGDFKRIQFTPDLLPSDLTGINFYNQKTGVFEFRKGPLFSELVLADEINRATPRTQSSLLEAMEERQVSVDGTTYPMAENFMVMATQNPLENYGTFPLPEAQTDRFLMRLKLGYMTREEELKVLSSVPATSKIAQLEAVVTPEETAALKASVADVEVSPEAAGYLMDIVEATRKSDRFTLGVSTRGALALYHAAQCLAALSGRSFVIPEDIQSLAPSVLSHRLSASGSVLSDTEAELKKLLSEIPVPLEKI